MKRMPQNLVLEDSSGKRIRVKEPIQLIKLIRGKKKLALICDNDTYNWVQNFLSLEIKEWENFNEYNYFGGEEFNMHVIAIGEISPELVTKYEMLLAEAKCKRAIEFEILTRAQKLKFSSVESFDKKQRFILSLFFWSTVKSKNTRGCQFAYENCVEIEVVGFREALKVYAIILSLKRNLEKNPHVGIEATLTFEGLYEDLNDDKKVYFLLEDDYEPKLFDKQSYFYHHIREEARNILDRIILPTFDRKVKKVKDDYHFINSAMNPSLVRDFMKFYIQATSLYLECSNSDAFDRWESKHKHASSKRLIVS